MKFIAADQFFDHFAGKKALALSDLIHAIETEFRVSLKVVKQENDDQLDVKAIAQDEEIIQHIRTSREDRKEGRVYRRQNTIDMFNKKAGERRRGTNV